MTNDLADQQIGIFIYLYDEATKDSHIQLREDEHKVLTYMVVPILMVNRLIYIATKNLVESLEIEFLKVIPLIILLFHWNGLRVEFKVGQYVIL
jgi:hypothetical protein